MPDSLVLMNDEMREPRYVYDVDDHYKTKHYKSKLNREWKAEVILVNHASDLIDCTLVEGQHNTFEILASGPEGNKPPVADGPKALLDYISRAITCRPEISN